VRAEGLTPDHAARLAKAGFTKLEIGLQSVNRDTLKRVKRGGSPEKVATAAKMLRDAGIDLLIDLILGLPGDTADDVARGVDFLLENDLGDQAQVFILSLLPGTALRASAAQDGLTYDPAPPYRVQSTATLDRDALSQCLFDAEEKLGRRLDELPRPHLVSESSQPVDVFTVDVDEPQTLHALAEPGAQHVALWFSGSDLFARRDLMLRALDLRLSVDPYATLDVVLRPEAPFPLDLIDLLEARLADATPSYATRALAHRGENLQRRVSVVLPPERHFPGDWLAAMREMLPVYREQTAREAAAHASTLGAEREAARITDKQVERSEWAQLIAQADPTAVAFAQREYDAAWVRGVVEAPSF
jgi:hypothetical protein